MFKQSPGPTSYDHISVQDQHYRAEGQPMSTLNKNDGVDMGEMFPEIPELAQESKKDSVGSVPIQDEY